MSGALQLLRGPRGGNCEGRLNHFWPVALRREHFAKFLPSGAFPREVAYA